MLTDALDGRSAPGEGELPLAEVLNALSDSVPLSLEVRSKRYRHDFEDPGERARAVLEKTLDYMARLGEDV